MRRLHYLFFAIMGVIIIDAEFMYAQVDDAIIQRDLNDYIRTGDQQLVEKIKQEAPDSKYYRFCKAYNLLDINNDEGLLFSRQLVRDFPDFAEANFALGTYMINGKNQYDSAIIYLDRAVELKPDFTYALFNRGIAEIDLKFFEAAKSDFSKVIDTDTANAGAYLMRAVSEFMLKAYSLMLADMEIALRIDPFIISDLYFLQVGKTIDKSIELAPENVSLITARGYANYKSGYFRLAVNDFATALKLRPGNSEYYKMMGVCRIYLNDIPGAESDLKTALSINPSDAEIYYFLGMHANDLLGDPEKSLDYFSKAIDLDSSNALYYYQRAWANYDLYDFNAALNDVNQAIGLNYQNGDFYYLRAITILDGEFETEYNYCEDFRTAKELGTSYEVEKYIDSFCSNK